MRRCEGSDGSRPIAEIPQQGVCIQGAGIGERAVERDRLAFIHCLIGACLHHGRQVGHIELHRGRVSAAVIILHAQPHGVSAIVHPGKGDCCSGGIVVFTVLIQIPVVGDNAIRVGGGSAGIKGAGRSLAQ